MMRRLTLVALLLTLWLPGATDAVAPDVDLHDLTWFVHVDMIDAGQGMDLAFYQALIDEAISEANLRLKGYQGPPDSPCCTELARSVSLAAFGTTGDGLDILDSAAELTAIAAIGLPGSRAFLVDSMTFCSGVGSPIGCAQNPACDSDPNDDPDLWMAVTMVAFDSGSLANTTAHERGHNACLDHVTGDVCEIMASAGGGGCLSTTECADYQAGRTTSTAPGTCQCQSAPGVSEPDGTSCTEVASGTCSGGFCGAASGDAGLKFLAAGGPDTLGSATDNSLLHSGAPGGWVDLGDFGAGTREPKGLAYSTDQDVVFGVVPTTADDEIVLIDPITGKYVSTVGTRANGTDELVALAYDPGPTSSTSDDRLLALESDGTFEDLLAIDPSTGSATVLGCLSTGAPDGFRGLAYDSGNSKLYTSSPFGPEGLFEIDLSCSGALCSGAGDTFCATTGVPGVALPRLTSSLSYSPDTGRLYLIGSQGSLPVGDRLFYDSIDATTFAAPERIGIDVYAPGGLAIIPVPEPTGLFPRLTALCALALLARRRLRA